MSECFNVLNNFCFQVYAQKSHTLTSLQLSNFFTQPRNQTVNFLQAASNARFILQVTPRWGGDVGVADTFGILAALLLAGGKCNLGYHIQVGHFSKIVQPAFGIFSLISWRKTNSMAKDLLHLLHPQIRYHSDVYIFSWEPALWTLMSQDRVLLLRMMMRSKNNHCNFRQL